MNDNLHTVWAGTDTSLAGVPFDFPATWQQTSYLVKGVMIGVNTDHNLGTWEEIDSVQLHGTTVAPEPVSMALVGAGLAGLPLAGRFRRFMKKEN